MLTALILAAAAALLTAVYFILSHRRPSADFEIEADELPEIEEGLSLIAGITNSLINWHNSVEIFENETLFHALLADMENACHSIHIETFVWTSGKLTEEFRKVMARKVEQGVRVRLLVDAIGAMSSSKAEFDRLRASGIELGEYRPIKRLDIRRYNNRTHRKLALIDGKIGYTFGHGVSDEWLGQGQDENHWRDTGVRLQGPVTRVLQSVFVQDWVEATARIPADPRCFPEATESGSVAVHVVTSTADSQSSVAQLYQLAIGSARREIIIQNPYFSPDPQVPNLLARMARKGVAVHLMVPGRHTDAPVVRRAGYRLFEAMLDAGVHIYEFEPSLLHQKIVVVDGKWSHIGSTNFDERSLALNAEIGVGILDSGVAARLKEGFQRDLKVSHELTLEQWRRRPWYKRAIDWCAYQVHGQL